MITETMSIHEALSELKMLDKRLHQKINRSVFCTTNKHSNSKINGKSIKDFSGDIRSEYESINALIARRAAIRNALSISNASTKVNIAGREYTVAEAIEMKATGMENLEFLLNRMANQFNSCNVEITRENGEKLRNAADAYVNGLFGSKDKSASIEDIEATRKTYVENHTLDLIDPLNLAGEIDSLEARIEKFKAEVDSKISISNATTTITVEY